MINGVFNALSGLRTSAQKLQNSANNLANSQTSGFKKNRVTAGEVKSGGSQLTSTARINIQGSILPTDNPTDLAIVGGGFFQVALPNGGVGFMAYDHISRYWFSLQLREEISKDREREALTV